jgi:hypothetical protein
MLCKYFMFGGATDIFKHDSKMSETLSSGYTF